MPWWTKQWSRSGIYGYEKKTYSMLNRKLLEIEKALFVLTVCLFTCIRGIGFAETEREIPVLQGVVVTADRDDQTFQTGDVDLEMTPAFYSEIKREAFEGKIEDVSEILSKEVGVQVRQSGGLGSYASLSLRGSSSEQVIIYMDGILLNDSAYGGVDLSNIALSDIESIEVFRGVTPLNFGKASIGGVVNIKTRRAAGDFKASISAGGGSFDTVTANVFMNHKPGKWDYLISGDFTSAKNDFWILNTYGLPYNYSVHKWERRHNNALEQSAVLTKAGYDLSGDLRIDISNQWFDKRQELPDWLNRTETRVNFDTRTNRTALKFTADNVGDFSLSGQLNYSWKEEEYDDRKNDIGLGEGSVTGKLHNRYTTVSYGSYFFLEYIKSSNVISLMVGGRWETYKPEDLLWVEKNSKDSTRDTFSIGLQDTLLLFNEKLSITPAVRYYYIKDRLLSDVSSNDIHLNERKEDKKYVSPQIGVKYQLLSWLCLKSNLARYNREPTFYELFGDRGFMQGSPELEAEKGVNFDIGFLLNWHPRKKMLRRLSWETAFFRSDVDDIITVVYNAQGFGHYVNAREAEIKGVENELKANVFKWLKLIGNVTWQDATDKEKETKLAGRYDAAYLGRVEIKGFGCRIYSEWIYETGLYYDNDEVWEAEDKDELNAGFSYLYKSCLITLEGKNLRNNRYEAFNGYPRPGRSFYMKVKYSF